MVCSDHSAILIKFGYGPAVLTSLAAWLNEEQGKTWNSIHFESVDESGTTIMDLVDHLAHHGCEVHTRKTVGCWVVNLPTTWEEYLAGLSKNQRKRCRRWQRTYFDSGRAQVVRSTVDNAQQGWHTLAEFNRHRLEQLGDDSAFADNRFHEFHLAVLPQLVAKQQIELRELLIDGESVASEYVFTHNGTVSCYQSGMRSINIPDGCGNLSVMALFHDFLEEGYQQLDFLRGDEPYKRHWGTRQTNCIHYHIGSKSLAGKVHVSYYRAETGFARSEIR